MYTEIPANRTETPSDARTLNPSVNPGVRISEWDLQASTEHGSERALPVAILLGMIASAGSLTTSATMMMMHFPVHTVLCLANRTSPTVNPTPTPQCYPNFFVATWMMMFGASALSFLFYAFLCLQQRELRLRQSIAMFGSFVTLFLWLSTISIGFLPTQVGFDSTNGNRNTPQVRAYGMFTSSIQNYQVAHNKTQLDQTAIFGNSTVPANDASQLVWIIGDGSGSGSTGNGVIALIYRANGDANRFWYKVGNLSAVSSSARTKATSTVARPPRVVLPQSKRYQARTYEEETLASQQNFWDSTPQPSKLMHHLDGGSIWKDQGDDKGQDLHAEPVAAFTARSESTPIHIWNMYNGSDFYKQETQWAMSATVFASLSFLLSFTVFLLLSAFPFI